MKKIGIICASDDELAPFLPHLENCITSERAMLKFYEGTINHIPVVSLYSGVCKVNAAIAAQVLIDTYGVDVVINAGTAGGMAPEVNIFDTVISTEAAYHDVAEDVLTEFHPWMSSVYFHADTDLLQAAEKLCMRRHNLYLGRMVTGEQFIAENLRDSINEKYAPLSVDMETGSIAHVCYANRIPFIAVRSITDTAEHTGIENFEENCKQASVIAKDVVLDLLKELRDQGVV